MTEQEVINRINAIESKIGSSYGNLRNSAKDVGSRGCQAIRSARDSAVSEATAAKIRNTLLPLIITIVGFFFFKSAWFLALLMVAGGIYLASVLNKKASKKQKEVQSSYDSMVKNTEYQQSKLDAVINSHQRI